MDRKFLLAAVVVVLIMVVAATRIAAARYDAYISGYWVGTPGFLTASNLNDFQLYIGDKKRGRRDGYLIVVDSDGEFVANSAVELRADLRASSALRAATRTTRDLCEGSLAVVGGESPMPKRMRIAMSIFNGSLVLRDDKKVYAILVKDPEATAAALAAAS